MVFNLKLDASLSAYVIAACSAGAPDRERWQATRDILLSNGAPTQTRKDGTPAFWVPDDGMMPTLWTVNGVAKALSERTEKQVRDDGEFHLEARFQFKLGLGQLALSP